ncbi:hypothetical protein K492DRAFT_202607 [Lichtheimia hyalospora FSU 10163]|nr:hypothetical protein K492DRAFT_202607 [Lichtheimia hyalospora FSU 10163]
MHSLFRTRVSKRRFFIILVVFFLASFTIVFQHELSSPSFYTPDEIPNKPSLFIAANLYNNEPILNYWITEVERLAQWAGPTRVFISVYENGSQDQTKQILTSWQDRLEEMNIPHRIITDDQPKMTTDSIRRIVTLAHVRNQALAPLFEHNNNGSSTSYDRIVYLNDIIFRLDDVVKLLNTNGGDFDGACGLDFFGRFYDVFATREIDGRWVGSGDYPYFADKTSQELLRHGQPVPVYSCWNGMAVFAAQPFINHHLQFRAILPKEPQPPVEASECCLIFTDLREVQKDARVFINPQVKVAYDLFHYWYARTILPLWNPFMLLYNHPTHEMENGKEAEWTYQVHKAYDMGVEERDYSCLQFR